MLGWKRNALAAVIATGLCVTSAEAYADAGATLAGKGLTLEKGRYILKDAEAKVAESIGDASRAYDEAKGLIVQCREILTMEADLVTLRRNIQDQGRVVADLHIKVDGHPKKRNSIQKAEYRQWLDARDLLNKLKSNADQLTRQIPKGKAREAIFKECASKEQPLGYVVAEAGTAVDGLMKQYRELGDTPEIRDALAELKKDSKLTYKLGPSERLRDGAKMVAEMKKQLGTAGGGSSRRTAKKA